jgi:hypothetical protein
MSSTDRKNKGVDPARSLGDLIKNAIFPNVSFFLGSEGRNGGHGRRKTGPTDAKFLRNF